MVLLAVGLAVVRALLQRILAVYFQISEARPQHKANTLEYSYFYHLSIVILILAEVDWNMMDLAIWVASYVGVGLIRRAVYVVRIERDLLLHDYSYNRKIAAILSASKIFGVFLFGCSVVYFVAVQVLFDGIAVRFTSLLLFPTLMLAVDSIFLLLSSLAIQSELLSYFNQNINELPSSYRLELAEGVVGNSLRVWHYYNIIRLFVKAFLQRLGFLDCMWILSVINACYLSLSSLIASIQKYKSYSQLLESFNRIFKPSKTAPDQNCVICMTELLNCRRLSTCGHLFHYKCLFEWIQNKKDCPICRTPINLSDD